MSHLTGLKNLEVELNPPYLGEWPNKIGANMLNFAGIEFISYQFLNSLEPTRKRFNQNLSRLLSDRIVRILQLVERSDSISAELKAEMISLWEEAKELSKWRNRIAHNPVLPTWKAGSDSASQLPDLIGVPDMKQIRSGDISDTISIDALNTLIDSSAALAAKLHKIAKEACLTMRSMDCHRSSGSPEIENYCPEIGLHGPKFVTKLLTDIPLSDPRLGGLRDFVE